MAFILNDWSQILSSAPWGGRRLHRCISVGGYIYQCGGYDGSSYYNDVWRTQNGVTWELVTSNADWSGRAAHGFIYYNSKFYVFGGSDVSFKGDVWSSSDAITWTEETSSAPWSNRHEFGWCEFDGKIWLIGGFNGSYLSDVWWTTDGASWTMSTSNFGMGVREHVSVEFLGKIWVFGGQATGLGYTNRIYSSSDGTTWNYDGDAAWNGRREHQIIKSIFEDRLAIAGGFNGSYLTDIWESTDGTTWTDIPQINPMPARADFGFVYHNDKAYITGGFDPTIRSDVWKADVTVHADFTSDVQSGLPPLTVNFTDLSTGGVTNWNWDFGDGTPSSSLQNPQHIYTSPGWYTVILTADDGVIFSVQTKVDYITVNLGVDFTASKRVGIVGSNITFTDLTVITPSTWEWDFGDSGTSTAQNPNHVYNNPGIYTVSLTATSDSYSETRTKTDYIIIYEESIVGDIIPAVGFVRSNGPTLIFD